MLKVVKLCNAEVYLSSFLGPSPDYPVSYFIRRLMCTLMIQCLLFFLRIPTTFLSSHSLNLIWNEKILSETCKFLSIFFLHFSVSSMCHEISQLKMWKCPLVFMYFVLLCQIRMFLLWCLTFCITLRHSISHCMCIP